MAVSQDTLGYSASYSRGVTLVVTAGVFWSIAGLVVRSIHNASEWQILFYRSLTLVLTLVIFMSWDHRGQLVSAFKQAGVTAAVAGLFLSMGFTCWIFALTHTTVANALFVLSISPFIAAIIGRLVLGEQVRPKTWLYMAIAVAGVAIMVIEAVGIGTIPGNLYAIGAATGFALFTVALRKGRESDMTPAVCWAGIWASIIGAVMIRATSISFSVSNHDLGMCAIMGVVQLGFGLVIFTRGSRFVPAAELALLSLTEVVLGPVWVWFFVGEIPTLFTLLGGGVVLVAICLQASHGIRRRSVVTVV